MRLRLLFIYLLISFSTTPILKSEDENSTFIESINIEESIPIEKDLNKNKIHLVEVGDTLSSISKKYSTNVDSIKEANNLSDENFIYIGQKLIIPEKTLLELDNANIDLTNFHEVKSGETLTYISLLYGIDIDKLIKINNIDNKNSIKIGTKILLEERNDEDEKSFIENKADQNSLTEYGPLTVVSERIEFKNNRYVLNAINNNGKNIILSLNCDKQEIDVRAKGRKWKGWLPAKQAFEKNILNDFCEEIND